MDWLWFCLVWCVGRWCVQDRVDLQVLVGGARGGGFVFTVMMQFASHPVHTEAVSESVYLNFKSELERNSQLFSLILYPNLECVPDISTSNC